MTAPDEILGVHDLLIHDYGPGKCFASIHAEVNADLYSLEGHDIIDELESRALRELNVHLVIHYDPILVNDAEWNEMRQVTQEIIYEIDPGRDDALLPHRRRQGTEKSGVRPDGAL